MAASSGGTVARMASAIPRRNFAKPPAESDVREPDGGRSHPEDYGKALKAVIVIRGAPGFDGTKTEELYGHLM
jgi:hypothetical protein